MLSLLLAASALIQPISARPISAQVADIEDDTRCLAVAVQMGGTGKGELAQSGTFMTQYFLGRVHGRAPTGTLARSLSEAAKGLTQENLARESKYCMMKFLRANEDLKAMAQQADSMN